VPTRKEIQWSQLRVGALVLVAMGVLIGLIFLMSASTGGMFAKKLVLRCYFDDAAGLKEGAPVTLQDVTIGNVTHIRLVPDRKPNIVEVTMQVGAQYANSLHTDSGTSIAQAGVLGDSYVHIDSTHAIGPPPGPNAELPSTGAPNIQDVIRTSSDALNQIQKLINHVDTLVVTINSGKGTVGQLINDPETAKKVASIANNIQSITDSINSGKGTLGKLVNDDALYTQASSAIGKLNQITDSLQSGQGTAGKLLKDDTLYKNLNSAVDNTNQLVTGINAGQGSIGKLAKDPEFARKLDETISELDSISKKINGGQGTLGQLVENRSLYDHADKALDETTQLMQAFRANPKKYLQIQMKIF
jgi:phospholipid/cholesterol/gamma-HCH transport system substrate-binding protein